jgi:hypothetical protein
MHWAVVEELAQRFGIRLELLLWDLRGLLVGG